MAIQIYRNNIWELRYTGIMYDNSDMQRPAGKPNGLQISANLKTSDIIKELLECLLPTTEQSTFKGFSGVRKLGRLLHHLGKPNAF
jgi:hypothetical protein